MFTAQFSWRTVSMATKYKGTPAEVLALNTFIKLSRATESFDARMLHGHTIEDLTMTQFSVLEALYHLGPLTQTELGAKLLKSGGNITLVIDNLERHGYVERRRCQTDRRLIYVHLTDSGCSKISTVFPRHLAAIVHEMSVLTEDEQRELGVLLKKLGHGHQNCDAMPADVDECEFAVDFDI
jgi:MarR family 2-MHQ and catechol resistance regulon transcriptional repressor